MSVVSMQQGLMLSGILFALGVAGLLARRNLLFILAMAASEVTVGLALVLRLYRENQSLDVDAASEMKG